MYQIGKALRATRALAGLSQVQMAERLNLSRNTLIELEKNRPPSTYAMNRISQVTGMSKEALGLMNMSTPRELDTEYKRMFEKIRGELVKEFISIQILK